MVGIHMNRLILHLIFQEPDVRALRHDTAPEAELIEAARIAVAPIFASVADYLALEHLDEYLASLCKNLTKCEKLAASYRLPSAKQGNLFDVDAH
jgi:hypothetical protein